MTNQPATPARANQQPLEPVLDGVLTPRDPACAEADRLAAALREDRPSRPARPLLVFLALLLAVGAAGGWATWHFMGHPSGPSFLGRILPSARAPLDEQQAPLPAPDGVDSAGELPPLADTTDTAQAAAARAPAALPPLAPESDETADTGVIAPPAVPSLDMAEAAAGPATLKQEAGELQSQTDLAQAASLLDTQVALNEAEAANHALQERVSALQDALATAQDALTRAATAEPVAPPRKPVVRRTAPRSASRPHRDPAPAPVVDAASNVQPRLLAIDSWGGTPSVVIGTSAPGDKRVRALQPGESINGIGLHAVDVRAGQATFDVGAGELVTLSLHDTP